MIRVVVSCCLAWLAWAFAVSAVAAPLAVDGLRVERNGSFTAGGLQFSVFHYASDWSLAAQTDRFAPLPDFPNESAVRWEVQGWLQPRSGAAPLALQQTLRATADARGVQAAWRVTHEQGLPTQSLVLNIAIPIAAGAGQRVVFQGAGGPSDFTLPVVLGANNLLERQGVNRLTLPTPGGTLEIEGSGLRVSLHDARGYGVRQYGVRIYFTPAAGTLRSAALDLTIARFDRVEPAYASAEVRAGSEWAPYEHVLDIAPGSVFDRSALADAPAGRHGRVIVSPQGQFVFAQRPDRPQHFYGVNLSFDVNFMEHAQSDALAERLQRAGYNAVRFQLFDGLLVTPGKRADELDRGKLDRLEYLVAALKRRGLYVLVSLYANRTVIPDEIPEIQRTMRSELQFLLPLLDSAFANWCRYARALLTHRNPHTGLTWAEEPAILSIQMMNEESFFLGGWERRAPDIRAFYEEAFGRWRATQKPTIPDTGPEATAAFNRFVVEIKQASDARMMAFLRQDLGVKSLITADNAANTEAQVFTRRAYDFVDNHLYWDHPTYLGTLWVLPFGIQQVSALASDLWVPRELMPTRIFGKPFVVSEFGYVWPNAARSESAVLMAGYAGLQGWDGLFTFDYASDPRKAFTPSVVEKGGAVFALVTDPIGMLADRAGAFLFLHGGVKPAPGAVAYLADRRTAFHGNRGRPDSAWGPVSWLGFITRVGSVPTDEPDLAGIVQRQGIRAFASASASAASAPAMIAGRPLVPAAPGVDKRLAATGVLAPRADQVVYRSETGQLELSRDLRTAKLVTPVSESFVLAPRARTAGDRVAVDNGSVQASVYVLAVDGQPLAASRRLLVLHLTDALNSGTRFADATRKRLEAYGRLPFLVRRGTARIALRLEAEGWQAWAVDAAGRRLRQAKLARSGDTWVLEAQTAPQEEAGTAALAYELVLP